MKINEFKKLEEKINNQTFNQGYKTINKVMFALSIFGHLASIFLAYFLLSKILAGAMASAVAVTITSIILLTGLELLKRDIFDKFSAQQLKAGGINRDVMPLMVSGLLIISLSFYMTISGAKEFSSKEKILEDTKKEVITTYKDSLTNIYTIKITDIEKEIKDTKSKIDIKDGEQTELEAVQPPTWSATNRIRDIKKEKELLRIDVGKYEAKIDTLKKELDTKIKAHEEEVSAETDDKKKDNSTNTVMFVLLSTVIELLILAGVYFNEYYKYRSYREFRTKIEKDPNYQKWMLYDKILNIIYTEDTRMNEKLPANKNIIEMCKVNDFIVMPKDITDFLKVMNNIGIIKTSGAAKYISKQRDLAFEALRKHFNIE